MSQEGEPLMAFLLKIAQGKWQLREGIKTKKLWGICMGTDQLRMNALVNFWYNLLEEDVKAQSFTPDNVGVLTFSLLS